MGGSHNSASSVINKDASLKKYSEQDTSVHINNRRGEHNIEVGRLGDGGIIFLQNLNQMQQPQQQMRLVLDNQPQPQRQMVAYQPQPTAATDTDRQRQGRMLKRHGSL